jgi:capsular polysaccharide transport system permease protein
MLNALRTQIAVIAALVIRGMQMERRQFVYGYVWTFLTPAATIAILRLAQHVTGLEPSSMGPTTFLVLGVVPIFMFVQTLMVLAKENRRGLAIIPRVSSLDIMIARGIMTFITYSVIFWLFVIAAAWYDNEWPPENPLGIQFVLILNWLTGLAAAFVFAAIARYFPPITEFKKFIVRPLRLISGMFFVITAIPTFLWPWFTWNPLMHVTELMRSYWFTVYTTPVGSIGFILAWLAALTVLGLGLERYLRRVVLE